MHTDVPVRLARTAKRDAEGLDWVGGKMFRLADFFDLVRLAGEARRR
jgi:hypothetical protein